MQAASEFFCMTISIADGPVEYLFVVDSKADPACPAVQGVMTCVELSQHAGARIIVAPRATNHSQKICNLIAGIHVRGSQHLSEVCACRCLDTGNTCLEAQPFC